jgi:hypothetical protein
MTPVRYSADVVLAGWVRRLGRQRKGGKKKPRNGTESAQEIHRSSRKKQRGVIMANPPRLKQFVLDGQ